MVFIERPSYTTARRTCAASSPAISHASSPAPEARDLSGQGRYTQVRGQPIRIIGPIEYAETIAEGRGIRERARLVKAYGHWRWRKCKGSATIELDGWIGRVELHWYEAHGGGRFEFKIKRFVE